MGHPCPVLFLMELVQYYQEVELVTQSLPPKIILSTIYQIDLTVTVIVLCFQVNHKQKFHNSYLSILFRS